MTRLSSFLNDVLGQRPKCFGRWRTELYTLSGGALSTDRETWRAKHCSARVNRARWLHRSKLACGGAAYAPARPATMSTNAGP
jgi:hypothetical protein